MTKKRAIQIYEKNIETAMDGSKRFSFILCNHGCECIVGIRFDDVELEYGQLRSARNGHRFKTSIDLGNRLEYLYYPLISNHERLKLRWEREATLESIFGL
jgi:hypothetical protein